MEGRCLSDGSGVPLSQIANDYFDATAPRNVGPTNFSGLMREPTPADSQTPPPTRPRHGKLFNDPVHAAFRLDPVCIDVLDSRQFQRLRRLKQLGLTYHVFPG